MSTTAERVTAIVTARGGSKGIPQKNLRHVGDRSLLQRAIDVAQACPFVTRVVVTTDSSDIQRAAIAAGAEAPFLRPAELASDFARQEDAVLHAMRWIEEEGGTTEYVALVQPTVPFRRPAHLSAGLDHLLARKDADAVHSVIECREPVLRSDTLRVDGLMRGWGDPTAKWASRQEFQTRFRPSALVTISRWTAFVREESFLHDRTLALVVDPIEALDIDDPIDLVVARQLYAAGLTSIAAVAASISKNEVIG